MSPTDNLMADDNPVDHSEVVQEKPLFASPKKQSSAGEADFETLLKLYYERLFPFKKFVRWMSYADEEKNYLCNREFSFTLKDDIYLRYKSFANEKELRDEIIKLNPYKIDIGAVYTTKPKEHKTVKAGVFQPIEKELVFDVDLTDYDDIRTCCSEAKVCEKCWHFMVLAVKIVDQALREDFGFQDIMWVFSGRRGVHCWVCDKRARQLSQEARSSIAEYLSIVKGGEQQSKKVRLGNDLHPSLERALITIGEHFEEALLEEQDILGSEEQWSKVLALIPDKAIQDFLGERWAKNPRMNSTKRWEELKANVNDAIQKTKKRALLPTTNEILLQYGYPRLDVNVSKQLNHLLKSPFCVHPKTGRVCVPFDPNQVEDFDPLAVPTVSQLIKEIDDFHHKHPEPEYKELSDYKKTSMKKYVALFEEFLVPIERAIREHKRNEAEKELTF